MPYPQAPVHTSREHVCWRGDGPSSRPVDFASVNRVPVLAWGVEKALTCTAYCLYCSSSQMICSHYSCWWTMFTGDAFDTREHAKTRPVNRSVLMASANRRLWTRPVDMDDQTEPVSTISEHVYTDPNRETLVRTEQGIRPNGAIVFLKVLKCTVLRVHTPTPAQITAKFGVKEAINAKFRFDRYCMETFHVHTPYYAVVKRKVVNASLFIVIMPLNVKNVLCEICRECAGKTANVFFWQCY